MLVRSLFLIGALALAAAESQGILPLAVSATNPVAVSQAEQPMAAPAEYDSGPEHIESLLLDVLAKIERQQLDQALELTAQMLERYPNYRLGHLIQGDLLLAQAQAIDDLGATSRLTPELVAQLRAEALARLASHRQRPPAGHLPSNLLQMSAEQGHAVVVDASRSRLYLFRNDGGTPRLVADYYVVHGEAGTDKFREGDKRTPLGVYRITSSLPKEKLIDLYGAGAFPLNYPNEWDRLRGRKGSGIWLHGTLSDTFARPPLASRGCIVLSNQDLELVRPYLQDGVTPVIIADRVDWIPLAEFRRQRDDFTAQFDAWRADAGSQDSDRLARHYSERFKPAAGLTQALSGLDKFSVFRNPGQEDVMVVNFEQQAGQGDAQRRASRVQYWMRESTGWKIVHETIS